MSRDMNLTPKRRAILEELYFEGPFHHPKDWRSFNVLHKAGLVEANLMSIDEARMMGYIPKGDEPEGYLVWHNTAVWRISQAGVNALDRYYELGMISVDPLMFMPCMGNA